jgi:hypothetical protein
MAFVAEKEVFIYPLYVTELMNLVTGGILMVAMCIPEAFQKIMEKDEYKDRKSFFKVTYWVLRIVLLAVCCYYENIVLTLFFTTNLCMMIMIHIIYKIQREDLKGEKK